MGGTEQSIGSSISELLSERLLGVPGACSDTVGGPVHLPTRVGNTSKSKILACSGRLQLQGRVTVARTDGQKTTGRVDGQKNIAA